MEIFPDLLLIFNSVPLGLKSVICVFLKQFMLFRLDLLCRIFLVSGLRALGVHTPEFGRSVCNRSCRVQVFKSPLFPGRSAYTSVSF